jgi:alkylation response protein AidB-like acyl-CoA dehydrogenase
MAALYVSESSVKSSLDAIQVHGAAGFLTEQLERGTHDYDESSLYSGASEIRRNIVTRGLCI